MPAERNPRSAGTPPVEAERGRGSERAASAPKARGVRSWATLAVGCVLMVVGMSAAALRQYPSLQLMNRYTVAAAAFVPYGLLAFAAAAVILATSSRRWVRPFALAAVAGLLLQGWWARPYWPATARAAAAGTVPVTLISMNLRCNPGGTDDLAALSKSTQPDVVVVEGFRLDELDSLGDAWAQLLPHHTFHPMANLAKCGTMVFSGAPVRELSKVTDAQPVVQVDRPGSPFLLLPIDFPTPSKGLAQWRDAFTQLTSAVDAHRGQPTVVVGDFNAVREHVPMRELLQATGLRDAAEVAGSGWLPTFPSDAWHPPLFGLDHALISAQLGAAGVRTAPIDQQEHRALVVTIYVPQQKP